MTTESLPSFRPLNTAPTVGTGQISVPDTEKDECGRYIGFVDGSLKGSDSTKAISKYLDISNAEDVDDLYDLYGLYGDSDEDTEIFQDTFDELERILPPSDSNTFESFVLEPRKEVLDAAIALGDCNFTTSRVNAHYLRWLLYGDDENTMEYGQYEEVNYDKVDHKEFDYDEESEYELRKDKDIDNWLYSLCAEIESKLITV